MPRLRKAVGAAERRDYGGKWGFGWLVGWLVGWLGGLFRRSAKSSTAPGGGDADADDGRPPRCPARPPEAVAVGVVAAERNAGCRGGGGGTEPRGRSIHIRIRIRIRTGTGTGTSAYALRGGACSQGRLHPLRVESR